MQVGENKLFYRGNPHTHQDYIPDSALKNRSLRNYLVQFPSGASYFGSSRKKQYSNLHNQSEIRESNLFYEEQAEYNHGTLHVSDIQGAVPNTLISQALKNKIKNHALKNSRAARLSHQHDHSNYQSQEMSGKKQQLKSPKQVVNYHLIKPNRIQTEPVQNFTQKEPLRNYFDENKCVPEAVQTDSLRLNDLEQQLFQKEQKRFKPIIKDLRDSKIESSFQQKSPYFTKNQQNRQQQQQIRNHSLKQINRVQTASERKNKIFPNRQIRKYNPTYLSSQNYINSEQVANRYF